MKVILSRKGMDSAAGGMPSPILPCGCLCSLPIPYGSGVPYSEIRFGRRTLLNICRELKPDFQHHVAHLDPDLRADALGSRPEGWCQAFGQCDAAEGHLQKQQIKSGDLFVFFGWFRKTINDKGVLRFASEDTRGRHIVYGWLQVGKIICKPDVPDDLAFVREHPHMSFFKNKKLNRIYVASQTDLRAGTFTKEQPKLVLTAQNQPRSRWLLDRAFASLKTSGQLSYHANSDRWNEVGDKIFLRTVARGQEFVFDSEKHPDAREYFQDLIRMETINPTSCSHEYS